MINSKEIDYAKFIHQTLFEEKAFFSYAKQESPML